MSYPVLRSNQAFAHVEVRIGTGPAGWNDLEPFYDGPCHAGQQWEGGEGEKLAVRHCMMPDDPGSSLSQPYVVKGESGLGNGQQQLLKFPT